jgi:hypothetical protein
MGADEKEQAEEILEMIRQLNEKFRREDWPLRAGLEIDPTGETVEPEIERLLELSKKRIKKGGG